MFAIVWAGQGRIPVVSSYIDNPGLLELSNYTNCLYENGLFIYYIFFTTYIIMRTLNFYYQILTWVPNNERNPVWILIKLNKL